MYFMGVDNCQCAAQQSTVYTVGKLNCRNSAWNGLFGTYLTSSVVVNEFQKGKNNLNQKDL